MNMLGGCSLEQGSGIDVLAPLGGMALEAFLAQGPDGTMPFAAERMDAVEALSASLMKDPEIRKDPASVAAAFWLRKSNLRTLSSAHKARVEANPSVAWVPVGRVFHVAPANVDTLFLYSWVLAFLCGNTSVVRLSRIQAPAVTALLNAFSRVAQDHPCLASRNRFVTYDHDDAVSGLFSSWCSHRIVWGGNATVDTFRRIRLNPHASERSFASKFSYGLFKAGAYLAADTPTRARLAESFFNDLFLFDQAACSSPQILFWAGEADETAEASRTFLDSLQSEADRRKHFTQASQASNRLNAAFDLAAQCEAGVDFSRSALVAVTLSRLEDISKEICGGGYLRVLRVDSPSEIVSLLEDGDQTITHFGFTESEIGALAPIFGARGVDRIVPVGEALAFDPVWDGFDLQEDCMRRVAIRR